MMFSREILLPTDTRTMIITLLWQSLLVSVMFLNSCSRQLQSRWEVVLNMLTSSSSGSSRQTETNQNHRTQKEAREGVSKIYILYHH